MRRAVTVVAVVVAGLAIGLGAYLQWWNGPTFEERLHALRSADFVVNTAFKRVVVDGDSATEAVRQGYGTVRANFEGPDALDTIMITLYADPGDAETAFDRLRSTAAHPILPPGGFFDDNGGFCQRSATTYTCGARFGDATLRGIALAGKDGDPDRTLDNAEGLLQAAVKNLYEVRLDLNHRSYPFVFSIGLAVLLLLSAAVWRAVSSPRVSAPAQS